MPGARPRTSIVSAWIEGWRRVAGAPILVGGLILVAALIQGWRWIGLPPTPWWPASVPARQLWWVAGGESYAFGAASAWFLWLGFDPLLDAVGLGRSGVEFVVAMILTGGTLDRLARDRRIGMAAFSAASGVFFLRFLRLDAVIGAVSWLLWTLGLPWIQEMNRGSLSPLVWYSEYGVVLVFVAALGLIGDVARVRALVEDRRSMLASLGAAFGFIRRRPVRVCLLYAGNMAIAAGLRYLLLHATPQTSAATEGLLPAGAVLWIYLVVRTLTRLGFMATTIAFFQAELAHAGYTARPIPAWPDSPAVEAIAALDGRARDARPNPPL